MKPCPIGEYSTEFSVDGCQKCPDNFTTLYEAVNREEDCYLNCPPGSFATFGDNSTCTPCRIGTYEDEWGVLDQCNTCKRLST
ncbi:hypothetical protein PENTCL1PPCAC_20257, partial [Pristionchus entomophagus]